MAKNVIETLIKEMGVGFDVKKLYSFPGNEF
jgi:hypothetical protein